MNDEWQHQLDLQRMRNGTYVKKPIFVEIRREVYKFPELKPFVALTRPHSTDYWVIGGIEDVDTLIEKLQKTLDLFEGMA